MTASEVLVPGTKVTIDGEEFYVERDDDGRLFLDDLEGNFFDTITGLDANYQSDGSSCAPEQVAPGNTSRNETRT